MGPRVVDGVLQRLAEAGVAETHEDDVGAVVGRLHDARDDVAVVAGAVRAEDLHRHDVHAVVRDAGDAVVVVRSSRRR